MDESSVDSIETKQPAEFLTCLRKISDHPFVTEVSKRGKAALFSLGQDLEEQFGSALQFAIVPVGSVGVGVANEGSDIDAFVFVAADSREGFERVREAVAKNGKFGHVDVVDFNEALQTSLDDVVTYIRNKPEGSLVLTDLRDISFVFAPATHEDGSKISPLYRMRKALLEKIVSEQPADADLLWKAISGNIRRYLVSYEYLEWGKERDWFQRPVKVRKAIGDVLDERFKTEAKVDKAGQRIQAMRSNFSYPSLDVMCGEFGILR